MQNLQEHNMTFNPLNYIVWEGVTGSTLYGTNTPTSDIDLRAICLPPLKVLLDPFESFEVKDKGFEEEDRVIYALDRYFKLFADGNPNIVEFAFVPKNKTILVTSLWKEVVENRKFFLSKRITKTFTGYAYSQLKRVENHRKWYINPPTHKPTRKEFDLRETPLVPEANLKTILAVPLEFLNSKVSAELQRERFYRDAMVQWKNYVAWRDARNPARKALEEKFGYDTKFVSHVFRLMLEGRELLLTEDLTFPLEEASYLLKIRNGLYTYDEAVQLAGELRSNFDGWERQSKLPDHPDMNELKDFYFYLVREYGDDV